jgi:hypothetical protein
MKRYLVGFAAPLALLAFPGAAFAQRERAPTVARLTPYVGYITFGNLANGPIGTRLANQSAAVYGVQLGLDVAPHVALVGNLGYADSNLEVGVPIIGGLEIADTKVLMYDGGLQVRLPALTSFGTGVVPFVEGGLGAIRYEVRAGSLTTRSTSVAANIGGGVDLQLSRAIGLRVMAKDYVGKFDFREATGFDFSSDVTHNWMLGLGLNLGF